MPSNETRPFISVVIPAFNEQDRLAPTLESVVAYLTRQDYSWEVTVVDDGSTDQTAGVVTDRAVDDHRIQLLRHSTNRGKGHAIRSGMLQVNGEWRLFMDADNSTSIDHLDAVYTLLGSADCQIVIGSRRTAGSDVVIHQPWWKELLGNLGGCVIRKLVLPDIKDSQTGFKIIRGDVAERILPLLKIDRWAFDVEFLAVARHFNCSILEHPVHWFNDAHSKVTLAAYLTTLMDVFRIRRNLKRRIYDSNT